MHPCTRQACPRVSIGLPVYNGERYLKKTVESLLDQTFSNFELIISDNASTDSTEDISRDFVSRDSRVRYFRSSANRGAAWNFNNAFKKARAEYFKWAAHDDLHHPRFLETCIDVLDREQSVVLCFTRTDFIDDEGQDLGEYRFPADLSSTSRQKLFLFYACGGHIVHEIFGVVRSANLRQTPLIGSYVGSDLVLLGRLALSGHFHQVPERLFFHREHGERSALSTDGTQGYTQWFDTSKSGRFAMPHWRRTFENTKSVLDSSATIREKLGCMLEISRAASWNRRALWNDLSRTLTPTYRARL